MVSLRNCGISKIIAIDDEFIEVVEAERLDRYKPEIIDELTNGDYDKYKNYTISEYIKETGDKDFVENLTDKIRDNHYYKWLESSDVDFQTIGVDIGLIEQTLNGIDSNDKSRKHLIILDRKLQDNSDEVFKGVLQTIQTFIFEKNLLLLIYTDSMRPAGFNSFDGVENYLKQLGLEESICKKMSLHFNYVQKSTKITDEFFESILKSQKANYIQEYNEIFDKTYNELMRRVWELNQNQSLFYYDYLNEGKHVDEILYEIFMAKFNQVYSETICDDSKHASLINPMRRFMQQSVQEHGRKVEIYKKLKQLDKGINYTNRYFKVLDSTDIFFGDILQIGNKEFMVLSQDCDVAIRNDISRNLNQFQIVEINTEKEAISEKFLKNYLKDLNQDMADQAVKNLLRNYKIEDDIIDKVTNIQTRKKDLNETTLKNLYYIETNKGIPLNKKMVYSIECIWLDLLLLKTTSSEKIILSHNSIDESHEIRYATKLYLKSCLNDLISRIGKNTPEEIVDQITKFAFNGLEVNCKSQYSDQNELIGFEVSNIKRIGRFGRIDAMRVLQDVMGDRGRIPDMYTKII